MDPIKLDDVLKTNPISGEKTIDMSNADSCDGESIIDMLSEIPENCLLIINYFDYDSFDYLIVRK